jgi:hypothetical protein
MLPTMVTLVLGSVLVIGSFWWLVGWQYQQIVRRLLKHPAAQVIHQFYTALQQHQYQHALQWIAFDTSSMTGAPRYTPTTFLDYARQLEQLHGSIEGYTFTKRMKTEGPSANYWLKVTRHRRSYLVPLSLEPTAEGWRLLPYFATL